MTKTVKLGELVDVGEDGWLRLVGDPGAEDTVYALDIAPGEKPLWADVRVMVDDRLTNAGDALIELSRGDDRVLAGDGIDWIKAGCGDDVVLAGDQADHVYGGCGDDLLRGQEGDDVLDGGFGEDVLRGGKGNDLLIGAGDDGDVDVLIGGAGADVFYAGPEDVIVDFTPDVDTLVIGA